MKSHPLGRIIKRTSLFMICLGRCVIMSMPMFTSGYKCRRFITDFIANEIRIVHRLNHHRRIVNAKHAITIVRQPKCLENRGNFVRQILQKSKKAPMESALFAHMEHNAGVSSAQSFPRFNRNSSQLSPNVFRSLCVRPVTCPTAYRALSLVC